MTDERAFPVEEGACVMCHQRPAEVYGLVCGTCKAAVDADEPWTHAHPDALARLRELEEADDHPAH